MTHLCACLGPQCGEEFCPCTMESLGLKRSVEWQERNSPESIAKVTSEISEAFAKIFDNNRER
jgi:hypothetical protein